IKPSNIMIDDHGEVRVMDFGIATEIESHLTKTRVSLGTPEYMPPEQRQNGKVDARSDLYSLGLVLQQMLTGDPHAPPRGKTAALVSHLCAEDPDRRYPSAAVAATAIAQARPQTRPPSKPASLSRRRMAWGLVGLAVVLGAGAVLWSGRGHNPFTPDYLAFYQRGVQYLHDADALQAYDDAAHMFYRSVQDDSTYAPAWAGLGEAY